MDLRSKLIHHSEKFKQLILNQPQVTLLETEEFGWENYRYESKNFRLAHVERYFHDNLLVLHITCFPHKNDSSPIFGFDVVCSEKTQQISGAFLDLSPVLFEQDFHTTTWNSDRKLPVWATIFSKQFIAVKPSEDEHDKLFELAFEIFETYIQQLDSGVNITDSEEQLEQIFIKQNEYCEYQSKNERTFSALKAKIGEDRARHFMTDILFPQLIK
jgi:hypothetical protein